MPSRLDLITLVVENVPRSIAFYRDLLGFEVKSDRGGWVSLQNEGVRLALWERSAFLGHVRDATFAHGLNGSLILAITYASQEELDKTFANAVRNGAREVSPLAEEPQWEMRSGWIADPDGNLIELTHHF